METAPSDYLACDGCGQPASSEHIARRLRRLEWTTRFRPVHIGTLLLGGVSPHREDDFLYAGTFEGEAGRLLEAVGISPVGKSSESVLGEFQRGGFFLAHMMECPLETGPSGQLSGELLVTRRVPAVMARIRRSLKPKRIILISELMAPFVATLSEIELGCPVLLNHGKPFGVDVPGNSEAAQSLRTVLAVAAAGK